MTDEDEKELIRLGKAAKMLGVHEQTLRAWDRKGILRAIRFGQRKDRRYRKADIEKLMSKSK